MKLGRDVFFMGYIWHYIFDWGIMVREFPFVIV